MDLFNSIDDKTAPLAWRMRPDKLEDFVGQMHVMARGKLLRRVIDSDTIKSLIIFGPPGSGKTAIAHLIANLTKAQFIGINAVTSGIADIRDAVRRAKEWRGAGHDKTILFIDEIHRFNKTQQDALLPYVEQGIVILIGVSPNPFSHHSTVIFKVAYPGIQTPVRGRIKYLRQDT